MKTIFQTDPRLRALTHTSVTIHNASQLALRDGDDVDALIVAVLVLANQNEALMEALQKCVEGTPPTIYVDAKSVAAFYAEQKGSL